MRRAFTLIELLVVMAIIAVLMGILLPTLAQARRAAQMITCAQNERQVLTALFAYVNDYDGRIPNQSDPHAFAENYFGPRRATNTLYVQSLDTTIGLGKLIPRYLDNAQALFCPADDTNDPVEELAKFNDHSGPAFGSYLYRQQDRVQSDRIDKLGKSNPDLLASCLLLDLNALIRAFPDFWRTNHLNRQVNLGYHDGHVKQAFNSNDTADGLFSIREVDLADMGAARMDEILIRADYAPRGNPADAPAPQNPWP